MSFGAPALDRLIESDNTSSMALVGNAFDNQRELRASRLPPTANQIRGVSVPPNPNTKRDASLPLSSKLESGAGVSMRQKHERGASLSSAPYLERDDSKLLNSKLDRGVSLPLNAKLDRGIPVSNGRNGSSASERKHQWTEISPALYATPVSTPLPDSPSSFSPSPYIINHKRRGPKLVKSFSEEDVLSGKQSTDVINLKDDGAAPAIKDKNSVKPMEAPGSAADVFCNYGHGDNDHEGISEQKGTTKPAELDLPYDIDSEDFVDPLDGEVHSGADRNLNPATPITEFYDAWEELSSESGYQLSTPRTDNDLRGMRMTLLMEIEKRKQSEEILNNMKNQWNRVCDHLSNVGIRLPEAPTTLPNEQFTDCLADVCQQVFVSRIVSESIARELARAEVEQEMEVQINVKSSEIARLYDKLRYYEAVNQEMSQRNQEIVETTRQLRQRRKRRQKWIWGSLVTAVTLATASLAYSYFQTDRSPSLSEAVAPSAEHKPLE